MPFLTDHIEPLTLWLHSHPQWALLLTFIISFSESLAIIGSIIPGSFTMTAIGIMAGSGILRVDVTYIMAILGAITGDGVSYALGYTYRDRLLRIWPFKHYPTLISYGQSYFDKHGAMSVLIGRFVGPIRSIIPVIAGMMQMNQWHFFLANVLSAIGWSLLYVTPGVLIGAASNELSAESSTRLFLFILALLAIVWVSTLIIKWLIVHTTQFLRLYLHSAWIYLQRHRRFASITRLLSPHDEASHHRTAALVILLIMCFSASIAMIILTRQDNAMMFINHPVHLFYLSLRTQPFDVFFIIIRLMISTLSLSALAIIITLWTLYHQDRRTLWYWLSLCLSTSMILFLLRHGITLPPIRDLAKPLALPTFPDAQLTIATALLGFFMFYMSAHQRTTMIVAMRAILVILLFLEGLALLYLGDNWITSVLASYLIGFTLCLVHWVFYRRHYPSSLTKKPPITLLSLVLLISLLIAYRLEFKPFMHSHQNHVAQYILTDQTWWNQQEPLLPIYSMNRIGQHTGLLNIQYLGPIKKLQQSLEAVGWKQQTDSFFYLLFLRAKGDHHAKKRPLMTPLYKNKKPDLLMTLDSKNPNIFFILRLWRSNYHLQHYHQPIWLGSVSRILTSKQTSPTEGLQQLQKALFTQHYTMKALDGFSWSPLMLPHQDPYFYPPTSSPMLLMIKDKAFQSSTMMRGNKNARDTFSYFNQKKNAGSD
jgi:membrane protein DedA with SNARE-associated domain